MNPPEKKKVIVLLDDEEHKKLTELARHDRRNLGQQLAAMAFAKAEPLPEEAINA